MHQARTEARAEAEVAAEQRIATALALERAELVNQARSFLCMCRNRLHRLSVSLQQMCTTDCERDGCICSACGSMEHWVVELGWRRAPVLSYRCSCSADRALPSGQVQQARAEARAEAEAAAEQRLAALDQARREEREAVVRMALALGAGRVRAPPGTPLCVHFTTHSVTDMPPSRHRAPPRWALAQGPRFAVGSAAGHCALFSQGMCTSAARSAPVCGEGRRLLTWERLAIDILVHGTALPQLRTCMMPGHGHCMLLLWKV